MILAVPRFRTVREQTSVSSLSRRVCTEPSSFASINCLLRRSYFLSSPPLQGVKAAFYRLAAMRPRVFARHAMIYGPFVCLIFLVSFGGSHFPLLAAMRLRSLMLAEGVGTPLRGSRPSSGGGFACFAPRFSLAPPLLRSRRIGRRFTAFRRRSALFAPRGFCFGFGLCFARACFY